MTRVIPGFDVDGYLREALPLFSNQCVNDTLQKQLLMAVEHHIFCVREDGPYKHDVRVILDNAKSLQIAMNDCAHRLAGFEFIHGDSAAHWGCRPANEIRDDLLAAIEAVRRFADEVRQDTFSGHRKPHTNIDKLICTLGGIFHNHEGVSPIDARPNGQAKLIAKFEELLILTHDFLPNEEGIRSSCEAAFLRRARRHALDLVDARHHSRWLDG